MFFSTSARAAAASMKNALRYAASFQKSVQSPGTAPTGPVRRNRHPQTADVDPFQARILPRLLRRLLHTSRSGRRRGPPPHGIHSPRPGERPSQENRVTPQARRDDRQLQRPHSHLRPQTTPQPRLRLPRLKSPLQNLRPPPSRLPRVPQKQHPPQPLPRHPKRRTTQPRLKHPEPVIHTIPPHFPNKLRGISLRYVCVNCPFSSLRYY